MTTDIRSLLSEFTYEDAVAATKKTKRPRSEHSKLVKSICDWIHARGGYAIKVQSAMVEVRGRKFRTNSQSGAGDVYGVLDGIAFCFDAKIGYDKLKPHQEANAERFKRAGGVAGEVRSLEQLEGYFRK